MLRPTRQRRAFTLLEILLVLAVLVALAAVAYPTLSSMYGDVKVKAAADNVRAAYADARSHAIEDGRPYRFGVQPGTGKFRVAPDVDSFWDGSDPSQAANSNDTEAPPFINEGSLPSGIVFTGDVATGGTWSTVLVFNPDGGCSSDVEIGLQEADDAASTIVVRVRSMTGAVTILKKSGDH
jgi:prepilin-type N-terminal cleavage/methylation domain-containing protein